MIGENVDDMRKKKEVEVFRVGMMAADAKTDRKR